MRRVERRRDEKQRKRIEVRWKEMKKMRTVGKSWEKNSHELRWSEKSCKELRSGGHS